MQPHEQRVIDERDDLLAKSRKLADFMEGPVYDKLDYVDRKLLQTQLAAMGTYTEILNTRIGRMA